MGKTGSVNWHQIKGNQGQIRLVPQKSGEAKKPGPNQRYKKYSAIRKLEQKMANTMQQGRGRRGPKQADPRIRRHIRRSKKTSMGAKPKSRR
ncbi:MAG: hypothetical protein D5R96_00270 [Methanocalculus sp. MSAO_Arc2]|uniref:DUF5350 domain-containing protein n=1 Tax=Methanocalculus sp. MSAO_Arc2 TaxID=2293855 RepID=UPI000FEF5BC4|nr:MAG: hypothetical protein D5R96_00270 [Methanocalculus sp. MSAO_Arc2]